jgi:hypothetical protein
VTSKTTKSDLEKREVKMKIILSAFFLSLCLYCLGYAGTIYKCIDENGNIYYTTAPRDSGCKALNDSVPNQTQKKESKPSYNNLRKNPSSLPKKPRTKGGYVACMKEQWLDDMLQFSLTNDQESYGAYIKDKKCLILEDGLQITVTDWPGLLGGKTGFIMLEEKFWALREAIDY